MSFADPASQPGQIQSLLDELSNEIIDLPVDQKTRIEATLQKIRARIPLVVSNDEKPDPSWQETEELIAVKAAYGELLDCLTDPCTIYDANLRMVYRNKANREAVQVPDEQAIGKEFVEIYPHLAGTEIHQAYLLALQTHQPRKHLSHWVRPSDGQEFYSDLFLYPTSSGGLIAFSKDATERIRTEKALREAHEQAVWISRFPDENPNPVARISVDGTILYCNRASADPACWGFQVGEQVSASFLSLLTEAIHQGKQVERDLQVGETFFSVTIMAFPEDGYVNFYGLDITERRRAEEQMRVQASIYEILYEPVIISDLQMKITSWNPAAERTYGWKEAEVIGKTARDVFRPEVSDEARAAAIRGLQEGKPVITETVMYTKDNRRLIVSGYSVPLRDTLGNIIGYSAVTWEITERKIADAALKKANQDLSEERNRLQAVMEALPIGISILDQNGGLIQNNKAFDAVWSGPLPPTTAIADYDKYRAWWVETGQPVQPEEWAASLAVRKGETVTGQFIKIQRFDGSQAYVLNSAAPIRNAEGEIVGSAVAIMDISQWIEAENALRESEQHFQAAMNSAPILVYECDRDLRYTWMSTPLRGFRAEDVIGKRDDEILPPEAAEQLIAAKQVALETGQRKAQEVKVPLNGEDTYYILTTDPVNDKNGKVIGLTCSAIDITEQKRKDLERQEQAIQIEVQRRLMDQREKDRYAIARDLHDGPIQTLSSTLFQLQMVKEVFPDPALQNELSQFGGDIKRTIQELRDVLNELRPPALIQFGFSKLVPMYIEDLRTRFPKIEFEIDIVEDDHFLSNDAHLTLFRIFQAGIDNIIRHADATKVWMVYQIEQDCFTLELRDNGKGFEVKKDLSQLTDHDHYGLVGMKERAEAILAEFSVVSEPGKGTTIKVHGPCSGKNVK